MVDEIQPGDFIDIDSYVKKLENEGYDTNYENIITDATGFVAKLKVNGEQHAVWEGGSAFGGQMVRRVDTPLIEIEKGQDK